MPKVLETTAGGANGRAASVLLFPKPGAASHTRVLQYGIASLPLATGTAQRGGFNCVE
jgi:hypothetical protein